MSQDRDYQSFDDFWPFYLQQHSLHRTRMIHIVGTVLALFALIKAIIHLNPYWLFAALILGYGSAWIGHLFVERNRPATFKHPLWSLMGDARMFWLWVTGRLETELARHNIHT